jgi:hypothetical protein
VKECRVCGDICYIAHDWNGCECKRCGKTEHKWKGCKCTKCGEIKHTWYENVCSTCGAKKKIEKARPLKLKIVLQRNVKSLDYALRVFALQEDVWGVARDVEVMAVLQSVLDVFSNMYGDEYILRHECISAIAWTSNNHPGFLEGDIESIGNVRGIKLCAKNQEWGRYISI